MIPFLTPREATRFYRSLLPSGECVLWRGPVGNGGRGQFGITRDGVKVRLSAHRVACFTATGFDPEGRGYLPSCGNLLCVSPEHVLHGAIGEDAA